MGKTKQKIFIVHGHDESSKEALAKIILENGLEPIILNERLNKGKTIIEKLESYTGNIVHAFVLYTPCDKGKKKWGILEPRARQNVIFEHGYLMGKLGREKITILYKENVKEPSDIGGIAYTELDRSKKWKLEVVKILNSIKPKKKAVKAKKDIKDHKTPITTVATSKLDGVLQTTVPTKKFKRGYNELGVTCWVEDVEG